MQRSGMTMGGAIAMARREGIAARVADGGESGPRMSRRGCNRRPASLLQLLQPLKRRALALQTLPAAVSSHPHIKQLRERWEQRRGRDKSVETGIVHA